MLCLPPMCRLFKNTQVGIKRAVGFSVNEESSKSQESWSRKEPGVTLYGTEGRKAFTSSILLSMVLK